MFRLGNPSGGMKREKTGRKKKGKKKHKDPCNEVKVNTPWTLHVGGEKNLREKNQGRKKLFTNAP